MSTKNPLSQHPTYVCDSCGKVFEDGDDIHNNEEGLDFCEECWHIDQSHSVCEYCGDWIEKNECYDENLDMIFCDHECQMEYISSRKEDEDELS